MRWRCGRQCATCRRDLWRAGLVLDLGARGPRLVFAVDADAAGQQQWRQLARQDALRGKRVAVLELAAYRGHKDVNEAWVAGTMAVDMWCTPAAETGARLAVPEDLYEAW